MDKKFTIKRSALPFLVLGAGGLGLVLRVLLYTLAVDSRGLLPRNHPLHLATLLLTAGITVFLVWRLRTLGGSRNYHKNFPASVPAGVTTVFAAGWMLMVAFSLLEQAEGRLDWLLTVLAFLSVVCLLYTGYCRFRGKRPFFLLQGVIAVFYVVYMVSQYRIWSANPHLPDYVFHIFACVFLSLTGYYLTAFTARVGNRRMLLFCGMMALYLCFLALVGPGDGRFYFGGGIWAAGNLCTLDPPKRRPKSDTKKIPTIPEKE